MANQNPDRNPDSRDTKKRDTSQTGDIGALASMQQTAPQPAQVGSSVGADTSATSSIGDVMSPSTFGTEPPPSTPDELDQRVARNVSFLSDPTTKAQLLQFGLSMLSSAGRGNIGSNLANAVTEA